MTHNIDTPLTTKTALIELRHDFLVQHNKVDFTDGEGLLY